MTYRVRIDRLSDGYDVSVTPQDGFEDTFTASATGALEFGSIPYAKGVIDNWLRYLLSSPSPSHFLTNLPSIPVDGLEYIYLQDTFAFIIDNQSPGTHTLSTSQLAYSIMT